jgi:hypothetical protein
MEKGTQEDKEGIDESRKKPNAEGVASRLVV